MSLPGPQGPGYDYVTALTNLRDKIAELSAVQQQQRGHSSQLSSGLQFWRRNKSNMFIVFTMYAMSTASVISAVMAESRLQVGCCCCRVVQVLQINDDFIQDKCITAALRSCTNHTLMDGVAATELVVKPLHAAAGGVLSLHVW